MPIFQLNDEIIFPPVNLAAESGIIAVGGDLSPGRLLEAYRQGIFPWYSEDDPIIWWSPDPRFVLFPNELKITRTMRQVMNRKQFTITVDREFEKVIDGCRQPRPDQKSTWITDEMLDAYCKLHTMGFAHSVETWLENELVGGLYGVSVGKCFSGESMFTTVSNASKAALITLVLILKKLDYAVIDCQVYTRHLESMGAHHIPRKQFMDILNRGLDSESTKSNWNSLDEIDNVSCVEKTL